MYYSMCLNELNLRVGINLNNSRRSPIILDNIQLIKNTHSGGWQFLKLHLKFFFLNFQVEIGDGMPGNICLTCLRQVHRSCSFMHLCVKSDSILRRYVMYGCLPSEVNFIYFLPGLVYFIPLRY